MFRFKQALGAVGMGVAMLPLLAAPSGATRAPVLKVTPNTGLISAHRTVGVMGWHLGDDQAVSILECPANDPAMNACRLSNEEYAETSRSGVLPRTLFKVAETYKSPKGTFNCATGGTVQCVVVVGEYEDTDVASAPISWG
jgi:Neocarzinostatin family